MCTRFVSIFLPYSPYSQLLESKHKKLQSLEVRHQREKTEVEERLGQEEAAVTVLREEMDTKDQLLGKLRVSTKEVSEIQKWIQSMLFKLFILFYYLKI